MFEKQYKETFSQVVASDSLMQEVLNLKNKRNKKIRVTTLLAAVILMFALATTAFAYASFVVYENPGQMLEALFGNSGNPSNEGKIYVDDVGQTLYQPSFEKEELNEQAAQEYVAPYIFEVGQSISYNGNTLTVDAASYDPYTQCGIVYLHLENPNGVPPYNTGLDGSFWHLDASTIRSNIIGTYFFVDEEKTTDTYLTLAGYFNKGDYMNEAVLKLHLEDDTQEIVIPLEATETMEHITLGNGGIQLSPIGLVIHGDKLNLLSGTETIVHYAKICYADGSEYLVLDDTSDIMVMNHAAAMKEPGDGYTTNRKCVTYLLNRVVPVNEVAEVIVDGVRYSVDPEPIDLTVITSIPERPTFKPADNLDEIWSEAATSGPSLTLTEGTASGSLLYTLTNIQILDRVPILEQSWDRDNMEDPSMPWCHQYTVERRTDTGSSYCYPIDKVSVEYGMMEHAAVQVLEDGVWTEYAWADIKNEDGTLKHGVRLILVDVLIKNNGARSTQELYYGLIPDMPDIPYHPAEDEFFIDRLLLVDGSATDGQGLHPAKATDYWSGYWFGRSSWIDDSDLIAPGHQVFYTFGFLVGPNQQDGRPVDLSNLYICAEEDTLQVNLIPLQSIK